MGGYHFPSANSVSTTLIGSDMEIEVLHEFAELAERLNFRAAALALNLSQSSLSRHISDLEHELGVKLFSRVGQLTLTYAGEILLEEASNIFTIERQLMSRLANSKQLPQGVIRLEDYPFSPDVMNFQLSVINEFKGSYPGMRFEFLPTRHSLSIKASVDKGYFDAGILIHCGTKEPSFDEDRGYSVVPMYQIQTRLLLYVHRQTIVDEQLWAANSLSIQMLQNIPLLLPLRPEYGNFKHDISIICSSFGFTPTFKLLEMKSFETLAMVDMRGCAQIIMEANVTSPQSVFSLNPDCKYFYIEEEYYATPYLLFSKTASPIIQDFCACAQKLSS
jgi:DNA-binding transcriptional LysR family regulator